jgi:hypothetical protein
LNDTLTSTQSVRASSDQVTGGVDNVAVAETGSEVEDAILAFSPSAVEHQSHRPSSTSSSRTFPPAANFDLASKTKPPLDTSSDPVKTPRSCPPSSHSVAVRVHDGSMDSAEEDDELSITTETMGLGCEGLTTKQALKVVVKELWIRQHGVRVELEELEWEEDRALQ